MIIHEYDGAWAQIVEAINDAGSPPKVRRIEVTPAEMNEIWNSNAFKTSVSNYYGGTSAMTLEGIIADHQGNVISMYLGGVLICIGPWVPTGPLAELTWPPLVEEPKGSTSFYVEENGFKYMLVGTGNPIDDMVIGRNADIELGLAIRKARDPAYYGNGAGEFNIDLYDDENWTFAVTVGSLNAGIPRVTDMYNIRLVVDTDPETTFNNSVTFTLDYVEVVERGVSKMRYVWYRGQERAITDSAQNVEGSVTQMIQQMKFDFISRYVPASVARSSNGSFLGQYTFRLEASPKFGDKTQDVVSVQVSANVVKKS